MTKEYMGVDIPVALLRDIAVRLRSYAGPERTSLQAKKPSLSKKAQSDRRIRAIERAGRLPVEALVGADPEVLLAHKDAVLRLTDLNEISALKKIISALLDTEEVIQLAISDKFGHGRATPYVISLTAHLYQR